jgi:hypothetical protein
MHISIIKGEAVSFKAAISATREDTMTSNITFTPREANYITFVKFFFFIGDIKSIEISRQLVDCELINRNDTTFHTAAAPDAANSVSICGFIGNGSAATTTPERLFGEVEGVDESEITESAIHGVASFGLMGFPWNNYMIS